MGGSQSIEAKADETGVAREAVFRAKDDLKNATETIFKKVRVPLSL
jgi:hypothetical protein